MPLLENTPYLVAGAINLSGYKGHAPFGHQLCADVLSLGVELYLVIQI